METKSFVSQMDKIRGKVGFQNCLFIRSMDKRGGLAMMWSDGTEFELLITIIITFMPKSKVTRLIWVGF